MADVVNLRRFRKARLRAVKAESADVNRAMFGRSRAERLAADDERSLHDARLDGHKREPSSGRAEEPGE